MTVAFRIVVLIGFWLQSVCLGGSTSAGGAAPFPTWTQDMPNKHPIPRTILPIDVSVRTSRMTVQRRTSKPKTRIVSGNTDDVNEPILVWVASEKAAASVNTSTAIVLSNDFDDDDPNGNTDIKIETEILQSLLDQQGMQIMLPTVLVPTAGGKKLQVTLLPKRTASINSTAAARTLGESLANTFQSSKTNVSSILVCLGDPFLAPTAGHDCNNDSGDNQNSTTVTRTAPAWNGTKLWTELSFALHLGFYKDTRFQGTGSASSNNDQGENTMRSIQFVLDDTSTEVSSLTATRTGIHQGKILATAVALARDVVNAPHNVLNAWSMAATAVALAQRYPRTLECRILNVNECQDLGMGAFLGVARGSETTARFIHITYRPPTRAARKQIHQRLGIVGKGLLFDTGGYNIKTGMSMTNMKFDCGGAAAVLGAVQAIAELEPAHVEVNFLIAACENMINERAMVPGDILVASNGKTIEVGNTDAEGRLSMADALVYADQHLGCHEILELSTLTGACMAALGAGMAGLFTHNHGMAETLQTIATDVGNKVWRMPMAADDFADDIKSKLADLKNIGGRFGGAITAALFLQHFVEKAKFAHVDMAGPVWDYKTSQASGWGTRLVTGWILHKSAQEPQG